MNDKTFSKPLCHAMEEVNNLPRVKNSPKLQDDLRTLIVEEKFRKLKSWSDEDGFVRYQREIDAHAFLRHDFTVQLILPWVWQVFDLTDATVLEVGSGTGSASAAFARYAKYLHGFDISDSDLSLARARVKLMGLENTEFTCLNPRTLIDELIHRYRNHKVDVLLLFAVLEHQTIEERLELLNAASHIVRKDGIVVVCETPNRLSAFDYHSSLLPYFNSLPAEIRLLYGGRSPRADYRALVAEQGEMDALRLRLTRFGEGLSFHEFELAKPDIHESIIADGFHPNIRRIRGSKIEDNHANRILNEVAPWVHPAFSLHYLDFIYTV